KDTGPLIFSFARFFGILRIRSKHRTRSGNATAHSEHAAAGATATASANAGAFAHSYAAAATRTNATARSHSVRGRSRRQVRHRVSKVRHVVHCHMNLRRNHDGGLSRQLWMIVAHHHGWRSNLLHRQLRLFAFGSLEFVTITAAATAASHSFGWLQRRNILRRRDQRNILMRFFDFLHNSSAEQSQADNGSENHEVQYGRAQDSILLVIVEAPNIPDWNRLGSQNQ